MKKIYPFLLFLLLMLGSIPLSVESQTWENAYGKLVVWPDVSRNIIRQKQYFNATWYKSGNALDVAFCFDEALTYGNVFYWNDEKYVKVSTSHVEYNGKHYYVLEDIFFDKNESKTGYWEYDTPVNSKGKWDMYLKLHGDTWQYAFDHDRYVHLDPWWNSNWVYKKRITIDNDQVPGNLVNFPVLINLSGDVDLAANVGFNDGRDIAFVDSTESVQFAHEIEYFNPNSGPGGGSADLVAWVNVTSVASGTPTVLYMYYGNTGCANQSNPIGVWDSDYVCVLHMDEASGDLQGSTVNKMNWTAYGTPGYHSTGVAGFGVKGDGATEYFNNGSWDVTGYDEMTVEVWYNPTGSHESNQVDFLFCSRWSATGPQDVRFNYRHGATGVGDGGYDSTWDDGIEEGGKDMVYNYKTDFQGFATIINFNSFVKGWREGTNTIVDNAVGFDMANMDNYHFIGRRCIATGYFNGTLDEIRFSKVARSDNWIQTSYNSINNASDGGFFTMGSEQVEGTVETPTDFLVVTQPDGDILLSWTPGVNSTCTRVEWNTVASWTRDTGTLLYNDSVETSVTHMSPSCNIIYYYQAWGFNSTQNNWSDSNLSQNISCPGNPSSVSSVAWPSSLNVTWTMNSYADTTVLVRKNNVYPSNPGDGTELYNGTLLYYNDSDVVYGVSCYTVFSYNATVNRYSTGFNVPVGSLNINVYDENTSNPVVNWDVFISNEAGTQVYESMGNSNTLVINIDALPLGDVTIIVNASDYVTRIFSLNLEEGTSYFLDCYLAWNDSTEQYVFSVVGPQNEYGYEPPVEGATIYFKRYINETVGWGNASIRKTSASGTVIVGLIPKAQYHITIVKSGYETFYDVIVPPPVELEGDRYFIFRLIKTSGDLPVYDDFWDLISFTAVMTSPGYLQDGNITLSYSDSNTSTVNTRTYLYEVLNNTITLKDDYYQTGDSFSRKIGNINTTRYHYVLLYFNNTASFTLSSPVMIPVYSLHKYMDVEPLDLNARITNVIGSPPVPGIPWSGHIAVVIPIMVLVLLGVFNTGIGIVGCGLSIGMVQGLYAGYGISVNLGLFALAPLVIVIGVIYIWSKRQGSDML